MDLDLRTVGKRIRIMIWIRTDPNPQHCHKGVLSVSLEGKNLFPVVGMDGEGYPTRISTLVSKTEFKSP
jgi:hypothetical protein